MNGWRWLWTLLGLAAAGLGGAALFVALGLYDVAASTPHTQPVYSFLEMVMRQSVRRHARGIDAAPAQRADVLRGAACFDAHCVACHGAPGMPPSGFGLGMQPVPPPLVEAPRLWTPAELYWITRRGIKMTGMPAWEYRLDDHDLWAVVALIGRLPEMTPAQWEALRERAAGQHCERSDAPPSEARPERGRRALQQNGCASCHVVDGVVGGRPGVGPSLRGFARRERLPGGLPNNHENLVRWLREPGAVDAGTAMPDLGLGEQDAHDIAAFLATQR